MNKNYYLAASILLSVLAGCSSSLDDYPELRLNTYTLPTPILIGEFNLSTESSPIRTLLEKFESRSSDVVLPENIKPVQISIAPELQTMFIACSDGIANWIVTLQFFRSPSETSTTAKAYITSVIAVGKPSDARFVYDDNLKLELRKQLLKVQSM